jgi:hypothetical protein
LAFILKLPRKQKYLLKTIMTSSWSYILCFTYYLTSNFKVHQVKSYLFKLFFVKPDRLTFRQKKTKQIALQCSDAINLVGRKVNANKNCLGICKQNNYFWFALPLLHQIFYYFGDLFWPLAKTEITLERIATKTLRNNKKKSSK